MTDRPAPAPDLDWPASRPAAGTPARAGDPAAPGAAGRAPLLSLRGVAKRYAAGGPTILDGVDLTLHAGERVALIGANGSGKSTLLRCVIGMHDLSSGEVEVFGQRFSRAPSAGQRKAIRRRTGIVFQRHCLVPRRSVLSNVCHGMMGTPGSWRGFSQAVAPADWRRRALEALDQVGLADRASARADQLSGGQQQRVGIARALVGRPDLLIADEPAASLDPLSGREVMRLFHQISADHGIALLFTTHDLTHAREFADRVVGLRHGRIALDRPAARLTPDLLTGFFDG